MEKKTTSEPSLPITNKFGKAKINISNVAFVGSNKRKSVITDKNGNTHNCPWGLKKIEAVCKKYGLMIVTRGKMVNLNYVSEKEKFSIRILKLINGKSFELSRRIKKEIRILFKKFKLEGWKDLIEVFSVLYSN